MGGASIAYLRGQIATPFIVHKMGMMNAGLDPNNWLHITFVGCYDTTIHILPLLYMGHNRSSKVRSTAIACSYAIARLWSLVGSGGRTAFYKATDIYRVPADCGCIFTNVYLVETVCYVIFFGKLFSL